MKTWGICLIVAGAIVALIAILLPTSVDSVSFEGALGSRISNLSLLQRQTLTFVAAAALFTSGFALTSAGVVLEAIAGIQTGKSASECTPEMEGAERPSLDASAADVTTQQVPQAQANTGEQSALFTFVAIASGVAIVVIMIIVASMNT